MVEVRNARALVLTSVLLFWGIGSDLAAGDEFPITPESTVIGRNYGYPSGTPSQGHPPVETLELVAESTVFVKNREIFGFDDPLDGETWVGFLFPLRFRYRSHERLSWEIGGVLGHNFGDDDGLDVAEPLMRLIWEPIDGVFVIPGTIFPTHWAHDAIRDDLQSFRQNAEQGVQFRVDREHWKSDTWINWRVREGSIRAEEFEVATSDQLRLFDGHLWMDGQLMWDHAGGQRSSSSRLEHNVVLLGGASLGIPEPFGVAAVEEWRVGGNFLYSDDSGRGKSTQTGRGWDVWMRLDTRLRDWLFVRIFGSYFDGDDLLARRGDPLYSLDEYGQAGVSAVITAARDLRVEAGVVLQQTESATNYTFQFHFSWGQAFEIPIKARAPAPDVGGPRAGRWH